MDADRIGVQTMAGKLRRATPDQVREIAGRMHREARERLLVALALALRAGIRVPEGDGTDGEAAGTGGAPGRLGGGGAELDGAGGKG